MNYLVETSLQPQPGRSDLPESASGLSVKESAVHGLGCFANLHFPKAGTIAEYTGERITHLQALERLLGPNGKHISQLGADHYIDGNVGGNETKYINHSCEPNADVLICNGVMIIVALREISPGDELTVDYLNSFAEDQTKCRCHSASCRKV